MIQVIAPDVLISTFTFPSANQVAVSWKAGGRGKSKDQGGTIFSYAAEVSIMRVQNDLNSIHSPLYARRF
jgi:hypothetical protein